MNKDTFCIVPFLGGAIRPTGNLAACCQSELSNVYYTNINDWVNSQEQKKLREDLVNGVKTETCQKCWNGSKLRETYNKELASRDTLQAVRDSIKDGYTINSIQFLDFKLGNLCNLQCVMCSPRSSSRIFNEHKKHADFFPAVPDVDFNWPSSKEFRKTIIPLLPNLIYAKFTGGEPLINPYIDNILDGLSENCLVHISTNATTQNIQRLSKFNKIWLTVSIDGVEELYDYIRYPGKWETVKSNFESIIKQIEHFSFAVTIGIPSLFEIDKTINSLLAYSKPISLIKIDKPEHLSVDALSDSQADKIQQKINNIHDTELKSQLNQILTSRKFSLDLHQQSKLYLEKLEQIRSNKYNIGD
jgi:sulfatase maturation enzyme AslB (radical SAM superfamily)